MTRVALVVSLTVLLVACGGRERRQDRREQRLEEPANGRRDPAPQPAPEPAPVVRNDPVHGQGERRDDRRDRQVENQTGWEKLGERVVDGRRDVDMIAVTRSEGRFTRIKLAVEHSAMDLDNVVVTFADGTTFSPETREVLGRGDNTRVIDLPGGGRAIRSVRFRYGNIPGGGRSQIELWAR